MHIGLAVSVLLHVAILGWAIFTIQTQRQLLLPETEPIAVDLVTPSEVTKVRQGVRTAKQIEAEAKETPKPEISKKEAPKPTPPVALPKAEPPPPPKEEAKAEPPKPEPEPPKVEPKPEPPKEVAKAEPPKPPEPVKDQIAEQLATEKPDPALEQAKLDEQKREEEKKLAEERKKVEDERKKAEEHKKVEEEKKQAELKKKLDEEKKRKQAELKKKLDEEKKRKEAEAKKKFDAENIAALLNKVPDKGAPTYAKPTEEPTKNKGPILGSKEGRDLTLSISERQRLVAMLTEKIRTCYRPPVGATAGLEGLKVSLSFDLKRDGSLIPGSIKVRGVGGAPALPVAVEAAERAIIGCQPYDMLPPDKYDFWKGVDLIFNPKDLFGG